MFDFENQNVGDEVNNQNESGDCFSDTNYVFFYNQQKIIIF